MFIQVIQGTTNDAVGLQRQIERWNNELRSGATGFISSTFGVTADDICIGCACFDTEENAQRNSNREEQTAWWNETEKYFTNKVVFHNSSDTDIQLGGPKANAGFVQVMQGTVADRQKLQELDKRMEKLTADMRPDLIGAMGVYYGNNEFTSFAYFTSEAEARAGEAQPMPEEVSDLMDEWQSVITVNSWFDITDPWITTSN